MNRPASLALVPKPVRTAALLLLACTVIGSLVAGFYFAAHTGSAQPGPAQTGPAPIGPAQTGLLYSLAVLAGGLFLATWLLGLGYVYADARRRAMRPILWVLVALFLPHLLGFLLFFVLREPVAVRCLGCGNAIPAGQRFCSWCGASQTASAPPNLSSGPVRP